MVRRSLLVFLVPMSLFALSCERVPLLAPAGSIITLTATDTLLPANGTTQLLVQVVEASGTPPHSGTHVTLTTNLGSVRPPEVETDVQGRAIAIFNAGGTNGTATITATSGGTSASGLNAVRIAIGAAAVGRVTIDANPGTISASGGNSTITSFVFDTNGNPLAGVSVTFTTDAGSVSPSVVPADSNGRSQSTLTTNRTARVTASAGNLGGGTTGGTGATGATGPTSSAQSASLTVTVNAAPALTITAPTAAVTAGQTALFTLAYGATGSTTTPVVRVVVDWGDGTPAQTFSGAPTSVSHTFSSPGSFVVRATATDSFGDATSAAASIAVGQPARPTVTIQASASPTAGGTTTFTIGATPPTGQVITSVTVDFGDGGRVTLNGNATSVQHVYAVGGTYTATAIATDSSGNSGSASTVIVVGGGTSGSGVPTASFTMTPSPGKVGQSVNFDASASASPNGITTYFWEFGDTTTHGPGGDVQTSHMYAAGSYTVKLTVTDGAGKTNTLPRSLTVNP
jgi:PKD domain/Bacterial Ig-like domain (group 1)